ncbi:MAG: dihydropteroate synthase [Verrucomicrobiia bacterium]
MLTLQELAELHARHSDAAPVRVREFSIDGRMLDFNSRPCVMGVINLSPDSWYRESVCLTAAQAIRRGRVLMAQGADLVDVGAESTLAHAERLDAQRQRARLESVIRGLRSEGVPVSVETYSPEVARAALEAGANILNLTGPAQAKQVYELAAAHDAGVIICYVQAANVREAGDLAFEADPITAMHAWFAREIESAVSHGVRKIVIDPGLGFYYRNLQDSAVRVRFQMRIFLHTFRLRTLGVPVCHAMPHAFEQFGEEVRSAEGFFAVLAALGRTDLFRTHEVSRVRAVLATLAVWQDGFSKADMVR